MSPRGFSLPELLVSAAVFGFLALISASFLFHGRKLHRDVSGESELAANRRRIVGALERDILQSRFDDIQTRRMTASLGSGSDGTAIWMRSPQRHDGGDQLCDDQGSPIWQTNILYYSVVPRDGHNCVGGNEDGWDLHCPHKWLIRKVIDLQSDPNVSEPRMTNASAYLTRPENNSVEFMSDESGVRSVRVLARNVLRFQAQREPTIPGVAREVSAKIGLVNRKELERKVSEIGSQLLGGGKLENVIHFTVLPRN